MRRNQGFEWGPLEVGSASWAGDEAKARTTDSSGEQCLSYSPSPSSFKDRLLARASYDDWDEPGFALTGYEPASYTADRFLSFDA